MSWMNLLRDGSWQFAGVILALIAILITIRQYARKNLTYEVITDINILNAKGNQSELQVYFKNVLVKKPRLVELKIYNSGNTAISRSDYEKPLEILFSKNSIVIDAEIVETLPKNIEFQLSKEGEKVTFTPGLLNSGDSVKIQILLDGESGQANIQGRVIGVRQIHENIMKRMRFLLPNWLWDLNSMSCSGIVFGISIALLIAHLNNAINGWYFSILAISMGCLGGLGISRETPMHGQVKQRTSYITSGLLLATFNLAISLVTIFIFLPLFQ